MPSMYLICDCCGAILDRWKNANGETVTSGIIGEGLPAEARRQGWTGPMLDPRRAPAGLEPDRCPACAALVAPEILSIGIDRKTDLPHLP